MPGMDRVVEAGVTFDSRQHACALVLIGTLETTQIAPTAMHLRRGPAVVSSSRNLRTPLDLTVLRFRYRALPERIEPVPETHSSVCYAHRHRR
jgi:hypothetical protein